MMDRRRDIRKDQENKVVIEFVSSSQESQGIEETCALTRDISVGGAKIITNRNFPVGTLIKIHVTLSRSRQTLHLDGSVKWVKCLYDEDLFEMGVEFIHDMPQTVLALIKHMFESEKGIPAVVRVGNSRP
jgi:Tfp pilus assembly protein PilZ